MQNNEEPPAWLFSQKTTAENVALDARRVKGLQRKCKGLSVGDIVIHMLQRVIEWNLKGPNDSHVADFCIAIMINLRRSRGSELHWSTCELLCVSVEFWGKRILDKVDQTFLPAIEMLTDALEVRVHTNTRSSDCTAADVVSSKFVCAVHRVHVDARERK